MQKYRYCGIIIPLVCLVLFCSGCRMRIVDDPQADLFLPLDGYTETESEITPSSPPEEEELPEDVTEVLDIQEEEYDEGRYEQDE